MYIFLDRRNCMLFVKRQKPWLAPECESSVFDLSAEINNPKCSGVFMEIIRHSI